MKEGQSGWVLQAVISRSSFRRKPRKGKPYFTMMSLHINNHFAKKRDCAGCAVLSNKGTFHSGERRPVRLGPPGCCLPEDPAQWEILLHHDVAPNQQSTCQEVWAWQKPVSRSPYCNASRNRLTWWQETSMVPRGDDSQAMNIGTLSLLRRPLPTRAYFLRQKKAGNTKM